MALSPRKLRNLTRPGSGKSRFSFIGPGSRENPQFQADILFFNHKKYYNLAFFNISIDIGVMLNHLLASIGVRIFYSTIFFFDF